MMTNKNARPRLFFDLDIVGVVWESIARWTVEKKPSGIGIGAHDHVGEADPIPRPNPRSCLLAAEINGREQIDCESVAVDGHKFFF